MYEGNKDKFLTAYLEACRADEQAVLGRVASGVRVTSGKVWLLSVIAKEDLWWPNRDDARAFYDSGRYAEAIAGLAAAKGTEQVRHELVSASFLISNFRTGENELLAKNVEGYDHRQQVESVRRLFEVLDALREWEGTK